MNAAFSLAAMVLVAAVVVILGVLLILARLIRHIVSVCVAKTRPQDMVVQVGQFTRVIGALEPFTPRHQGGRGLVSALRDLLPGRPGTASVPTDQLAVVEQTGGMHAGNGGGV